jgi:hypothetical protein
MGKALLRWFGTPNIPYRDMVGEIRFFQPIPQSRFPNNDFLLPIPFAPLRELRSPTLTNPSSVTHDP